MKNWKDTIIKAIGTLKTDENGDFALTAKEFNGNIKYTATLVITDNSPLNVLRRKNYWVYIDGIRECDKQALEALKKAGTINAKTLWVVSGHLVRTPGKPGQNDLYNLKSTGMDLAKENDTPMIDFNEALTKEEWQVIYREKSGKAATSAPVAPTAPTAPF